MPKPTYATVEDYLHQLNAPLREVVEAVRQIILGTSSDIGEQVKWNSPSFYYRGEMAPFDPKTYQRDIAVMNLHRGQVLLVFPTGATVPDPAGLLEGQYPDGRRLLKIHDLADAQAKAAGLQQVLRSWLARVELLAPAASAGEAG